MKLLNWPVGRHVLIMPALRCSQLALIAKPFAVDQLTDQRNLQLLRCAQTPTRSMFKPSVGEPQPMPVKAIERSSSCKALGESTLLTPRDSLRCGGSDWHIFF